MVVGVVRLVLQLPGVGSLKARRRIVRSFKDRLRARLPVTVAEVGDVERYQVATLGIAVISSDRARCEEILARATSMARTLPDAVLADVATELIHMGEGGRSLPSDLGDLHPAQDPASPEDEPLPWDPRRQRPGSEDAT